jgi:uncharacterized protein YggE
MKALSLGVLILAFCVSPAVAQESRKPPTIEVSATAELMVPPDEVVFSLDVTKRNKDMQIAKQEADTALANIISLTRKFAVKPENVRTAYISIEKKFKSFRDPKNRIYDEDGDEIGTQVFLGYDVSTTVIVRLTDLKQFEGFYAEVTKTGVSQIDSVNFESSDIIAQTKQVRVLAMKAALEKATAMAGAIDQTVGKAINIAEGAAGTPTYLLNGSVTANSIGAVRGPAVVTQSVASFSPGAIKISSQVTVTFLLN